MNGYFRHSGCNSISMNKAYSATSARVKKVSHEVDLMYYCLDCRHRCFQLADGIVDSTSPGLTVCSLDSIPGSTDTLRKYACFRNTVIKQIKQ